MALGFDLSSGLEHARLEGGGMVVAFLLNPMSLRITRTSRYSSSSSRSSVAGRPAYAASGRSSSNAVVGHNRQQYTGSPPATLNMTVWFDQSFERDGYISYEIDQLQSWTCPTERSIGGARNPARVTFTWGTLQFEGHIQQLLVDYKLFGTGGRPVRAAVTITMTENPSAVTGTNPSSGGTSGRRVHIVAAGDSLHSVANAELGSPGLWRVLAQANGIDDPLRVTPGTLLLIPPAASSDER